MNINKNIRSSHKIKFCKLMSVLSRQALNLDTLSLDT